MRHLLHQACAALLMLAIQVQAVEAVAGIEASCKEMKLQKALGVPDQLKHVYEFRGTCKIVDRTENDRLFGADFLWAEAVVTWDGTNGTLDETVVFSQSQVGKNGKVHSAMKCARDPIVHTTSCIIVSHENGTGWKILSDAPLNQLRPITKGKTSLEEATALSKLAAASPTPGSDALNAGGAAKVLKKPGSATNDTKQSSGATQLPAVQQPTRAPNATRTAAAAMTPSWGAVGIPSRGVEPVPAMNAGATLSVKPQASVLKAPARASTGMTHELAAVSCSASLGGLRFACTTRAGFDKCESLRAQHKVDQCSLDERR